VETFLEENRALNNIIATLAEQAKQVAVKVQQAHQVAAKASQDVVGCDLINAQLFQLATLLAHLQMYVQANAGAPSLPTTSHSGPLTISGQPIGDYVLKIPNELDAFSSCIKSEYATIGDVPLHVARTLKLNYCDLTNRV
jgi:hypothetical protein